jgi:hypothetical protein
MTTLYAVTYRNNTLTMFELPEGKEKIVLQRTSLKDFTDANTIYSSHYEAWKAFKYIKALFS